MRNSLEEIFIYIGGNIDNTPKINTTYYIKD